MNVLICIDDTDSLDSRGTGELAEMIADRIEHAGRGHCSAVTRHQLLLHDDIPYTSHNSSMCFRADLNSPEELQPVIELATGMLETESAEGSDPGLAVAEVALLSKPEEVVEFGQRAKREVLTKDAAQAFAHKQGIHLTEHGGTGQGIIGALAGIGLRLSGNDGRVKGRLKVGEPGATLSIAELLRHPQVDRVCGLDGAVIPEDGEVLLGEKVKTVWLNHQAVLLVSSDGDGTWQTCGKQQLRKF